MSSHGSDPVSVSVTTTADGPRTPPWAIWWFAALSAVNAAGYGVLFTVVGDFRSEYGISETEVGLVIGLGFLSGFVSQLFIAPIADRGRARQLVIAGVALDVAGLLLIGLGGSAATVFIGRLVSGIGIGAANPAIRRIVIQADPEHLGRNLGRLLSADVFGFAMGPAVSAVLVGPLGLAAPFVAIATVATILVVPVVVLPLVDRPAATGQRLAVDLLRQPAVAGAVALGAGVFLMIGGFDALWDVVHEDLDTPDWIANLGITLFAIPLVLFGPLSGSMAQRHGPYRIAAVGLLAGACFMTSYGLLPTGRWIFAVAMGHALVDGLTIAASGVAIGMAVPEERQAGAQGLMGAAQALLAGIAAIVIGGVYDVAGRAAAYGVTAAGMVLCVVVGLTLAREFRRSSGLTGGRPRTV